MEAYESEFAALCMSDVSHVEQSYCAIITSLVMTCMKKIMHSERKGLIL